MSSLDRALQRYYLKLFDIGHQKWCLFKPQTTKRQACIRRRAIKEEETAEIAELLNRMHAKLCSHDSAGNAELRGILRQFIRATACCVHAYSVVKDGKLLERTVLKVLKTLEDGGPFRIAEKSDTNNFDAPNWDTVHAWSPSNTLSSFSIGPATDNSDLSPYDPVNWLHHASDLDALAGGLLPSKATNEQGATDQVTFDLQPLDQPLPFGADPFGSHAFYGGDHVHFRSAPNCDIHRCNGTVPVGSHHIASAQLRIPNPNTRISETNVLDGGASHDEMPWREAATCIQELHAACPFQTYGEETTSGAIFTTDSGTVASMSMFDNDFVPQLGSIASIPSVLNSATESDMFIELFGDLDRTTPSFSSDVDISTAPNTYGQIQQQTMDYFVDASTMIDDRIDSRPLPPNPSILGEDYATDFTIQDYALAASRSSIFTGDKYNYKQPSLMNAMASARSPALPTVQHLPDVSLRGPNHNGQTNACCAEIFDPGSISIFPEDAESFCNDWGDLLIDLGEPLLDTNSTNEPPQLETWNS